ncbi:MAG: hypothetical protein H6598_03245 [Flavobacteriales bacterium]|nr:hypothetical protein [Flavobacteriales bacterium]
MLKFFHLSILTLLVLSCSEDAVSINEAQESKEKPVNTKKSTLTEFSSHFVPISELPDLDLKDMGISLVLDNKSFQLTENMGFLDPVLVQEWIFPYFEITPEGLNEENWMAILYNEAEHNSIYCIAQVNQNDIKFYLLRLNIENDENSDLTLLGSIGSIKYRDSNEEAGEKYDFEITDCEDLILEIKGDTLITKCYRYSATVGKDWRVDQNLHVNDTIKFPVIENSYSLY